MVSTILWRQIILSSNINFQNGNSVERKDYNNFNYGFSSAVLYTF